jgi:hypothetical protein
MPPQDDPTNPKPSEQPSPEAILRVVLGQSSIEEAAAIEQRIARDPAVARIAAILRDLRGVLTELSREETDRPSPAALARAKALARELPNVPTWLDRLTATVLARIDGAATDLVAGLAPAPALRGASNGGMQSFADSLVRIDAEPRRNADGSFMLRMEVDAEMADSLAGDYLVIESSSGAVLASGRTTEDGAAQILVAADTAESREVEIALRLNDRTLMASGIVLA